MAANLSSTVAFSGRSQNLTEAEDTLFGWSHPEGRSGLIILLTFVAGLTCAYWRMLVDTSQVWVQPQYSHGWIVPLIGLYVFWCRRPDQTERRELSMQIWVAVGAGVALVAAGYFAKLEWLQGMGLVVSLIGIMAAGLLHQPFSELGGGSWKPDLQSPSERVLIGSVAISTIIVGLGFTGLIPVRLFSPLLLLALFGYAATLLAVSLASRSGPLPRTGGENWAALMTIVGSSLVWMQASPLDMMPLMQIAFIATLFGVFGLVGGRRLLRWAGPGVMFLVFMFPFPSVVEKSVLGMLQKVAAAVSTIVMQVIGLPCWRVGSVIDGLGMPLEVAEACSGLRMSTIFGAMTVAMVFLIRRPWWDKFTLLLSAVPVALVVNIIRIVVTGIIYYSFPDNANLHNSVHDLAGYAMMPLALGVLWLELTILSNLTVAEEVGYQAPGAARMPGV